MAEESADDAAFVFFAVCVEQVGSEEVHNDVVVVAGVERYVAAGFGYGADNVERLVTIEGGDLDGDDVFDFGEFFPEFVTENAAADGWLQVETDDGDDLRDGTRVIEKFFIAGFFQGGKA